MCGICGIFGQNPESITNMLLEMEHRGKDGSGIYGNNNVKLGHTRLAIIDLTEHGRQPMHNENNTVFMVVNGEIYNYKELNLELRDKGHRFYSTSDSEVIIHAYEQWGDSFVQKLRGMFALAVYDKNINKLILARDPIGKKPLYYYTDGKNLYFASEIKALLKANVPCSVNYDMIPTYLMYQYSMGEQTLFKGIKKLMAGHMLVAGNGEFYIEPYFQIKDSLLPIQEKDAVLRLRWLLDESVRLRLQSDVPIGAFLSGGIDSSAVLALWRKQTNSKIHTFTATFDTNSEAKYALLVSRYLNVESHFVPINVDMVFDDLKKITWHHDEPLGDAATINNYYLSREASKYVKVVLAGEGGDEVFGGYPWHKFSNLISLFNDVPEILRKLGQLYFNGDITSKSYKFTRMALFPLQDNLVDMELFPTSVTSKQNVEWLTGMKSVNHAITSWVISNPYNQMLAMDCLNKLPEQFLMKADKATMANTIEERLPLLDKEIIKFAFTLPIKYKRDKFILRKAVEDLLPSEIVWRKKQGFGTPIADWLNNHRLKEYVLDRISQGELIKYICKPKPLDKVVNMYKSDKYKAEKSSALSFPAIIWSLFALQVWHDTFIGGG